MKDKVLQKIASLRQSDVGRSLWSSGLSNERAWMVSLWGNTPSFHKLVVGEEYLLLDGCGSFYKNGNSVGYFQMGTIMKVLEKDNDVAKVSLKGSTFRVTSDASFANRGSTFAVSEGVEVEGGLYETHYRINMIAINDITEDRL